MSDKKLSPGVEIEGFCLMGEEVGIGVWRADQGDADSPAAKERETDIMKMVYTIDGVGKPWIVADRRNGDKLWFNVDNVEHIFFPADTKDQP